MLPTYQQQDKNTIEQLKRQVAKLTENQKAREPVFLERIKKESHARSIAERALKAANARLTSIPIAQRFSRETPFPVDFRLIDIGDVISNVESAYKDRATEIEKYPGWWSVSFKDGNFIREATFYRQFDDDDSSRIDHALLFLGDDDANSLAALKQALRSVYGTGEIVRERDGHEETVWRSVGKWRQDGAYEIALDDNTIRIDLNCETWAKIYKKNGAAIECKDGKLQEKKKPA